MVMWAGGRRGDGGIAKNVEILRRDVAADTQCVAGKASRIFRANIFKVHHHGPTRIKFAFQHRGGLVKAPVVRRKGDKLPALAEFGGGIKQVPPVGAGAER